MTFDTCTTPCTYGSSIQWTNSTRHSSGRKYEGLPSYSTSEFVISRFNFNLVRTEKEAFERLCSDASNEESNGGSGSTTNSSTDWQIILFSTEKTNTKPKEVETQRS